MSSSTETPVTMQTLGKVQKEAKKSHERISLNINTGRCSIKCSGLENINKDPDNKSLWRIMRGSGDLSQGQKACPAAQDLGSVPSIRGERCFFKEIIAAAEDLLESDQDGCCQMQGVLIHVSFQGAIVQREGTKARK